MKKVDFKDVQIGDTVTLSVTGEVTGKDDGIDGKRLFMQLDEQSSDFALPAEGDIYLDDTPPAWVDGDQVLTDNAVLWERTDGWWDGFSDGIWSEDRRPDDMVDTWVEMRTVRVVRRGGKRV